MLCNWPKANHKPISLLRRWQKALVATAAEALPAVSLTALVEAVATHAAAASCGALGEVLFWGVFYLCVCVYSGRRGERMKVL